MAYNSTDLVRILDLCMVSIKKKETQKGRTNFDRILYVGDNRGMARNLENRWRKNAKTHH